MKTPAEIATEIGLPSPDELADRRMFLLDQDFFGITLNAPAEVELGAGQLEVVLSWRATGLRAWQVARDTNVILGAIDRDSGEVFFGQVFRNPKDEERRMLGEKPPPPEDASASSVGAGIWRRDARAILDFPWGAARLRLFAICFDWVSNVVDVEIAGSVPGPVARRVQPARELAPLPTYIPWATIAWPTDPEVLSFGIGNDPTRGLVAWGALGLMATPYHLALPAKILEADAVERSVSAIVPLTIAIVSVDCRVPFRLDLAIPIYGPSSALAGDALRGSFIVDVNATLRTQLTPGEHRAYAMIEGRLVGPLAFSV